MDVGWRRETAAMDGLTTNVHTTTEAMLIRRDKGVRTWRRTRER